MGFNPAFTSTSVSYQDIVICSKFKYEDEVLWLRLYLTWKLLCYNSHHYTERVQAYWTSSQPTFNKLNQLFFLKHSSVEDLLQCVGVNDMYYSEIPIKPTPYFLFSLVSVKHVEQETDIMHPHYNKTFYSPLAILYISSVPWCYEHT